MRQQWRGLRPHMTALHHTISMQHAEEICIVHLAASRDTWCDCMFQISFACSQIQQSLKVWWASVHVQFRRLLQEQCSMLPRLVS